MLTLAWEPGGPPTPYHLLPFIRLGRILNRETGAPYHGHHQPRNLPLKATRTRTGDID